MKTKKIFFFLSMLVSQAMYAQVHDLLVTDTTHIDTKWSEDSVKYFSFKNIKQLDGHWLVYYDEPKQHKAMEATFVKGKLSGTETHWYEDGKLMSEKRCEKDTCTTDYYYSSGTLMQRDIEAVDAAKGTVNRFYSVRYCENGQIKFSPALNLDSKSSQFITTFYCSGTKKEEYTILIISGKQFYVGPYTEWYENGRLKTLGHYDDTNPKAAGQKIGRWHHYNPDGSLLRQELYENDKVIDKMDY